MRAPHEYHLTSVAIRTVSGRSVIPPWPQDNLNEKSLKRQMETMALDTVFEILIWSPDSVPSESVLVELLFLPPFKE